jgi:hypothetical protein
MGDYLLQSDKTDRWWIEIPFTNVNNKIKKIRYYHVRMKII